MADEKGDQSHRPTETTLSERVIDEIEDARTVGGSPSIELTDGELFNLARLVTMDLDMETSMQFGCSDCRETLSDGFYDIPIEEVGCESFDDTFGSDSLLKRFIASMRAENRNAFQYYTSLVQIHSYRRKFKRVRREQTAPKPKTVLPRGLLEAGSIPEEELAVWLVFRKYLYDIDNRSAQTTGYLFEPILAESIGGQSYSARKSPVRRNGSGSGRQVDCVAGRTAYEFKMRVTAAASGQGRFEEEMQFAEDARRSGFRPVLVVLGPASSSKFEMLSGEFERCGGRAYAGDDAWSHLESQASEEMGMFIEKYIREPISELNEQYDAIERVMEAVNEDGVSVEVQIGDESHQFDIA